MFDEILDPRDKLKALRKLLNVTQDNITKSFKKSQISKIENHKAKLTLDVAKEAIECAKEIGKKRGIEIDITLEDLMKDTSEQILETANNYYKKLKNIEDILKFEGVLLEFERFMKEHNLYKEYELKFLVFKLAVDIYFKNEKFNICKTYILKSIDAAFVFNKDNVADLVLILTRIYSLSEEFESILVWGKYITADGYASEDTLKKINFNIARAYHKLSLKTNENYMENLSESVKILSEIQNKFQLTSYEKCQSDILLASCYREKREFKKAERSYIKIISNTKDNLSKMLAYENLAKLYYLKKEFLKAKDNIEKALNCMEKINDVIGIEIEYSVWYHAMLIFCNLNEKNDNFNKIKIYFYRSIKAAKRTENFDIQTEAYKTFIEYCIKNKKNRYIDLILIKVYKKIECFKNREIQDVFIKAAEYYKKINTEKFHYIFNLIFNITLIFERKKCK